MAYRRRREGVEPLGSFEVSSGALIVTDPCYDRGTWCAGKLENVRNGTWNVDVRYDQGRVAELMAYMDGYDSDDAYNKTSFEVGVDSGQAGIFCDSIYPQGERPDDDNCEYNKDAFYDRCCKGTLDNEKNASIIDGKGVVSSTGWGDGGYEAFFGNDKGEIIAVRIVFMPEEVQCTQCGSFFDEDELTDGICSACDEDDRCEDCGRHFDDCRCDEPDDFCPICCAEREHCKCEEPEHGD